MKPPTMTAVRSDGTRTEVEEVRRVRPATGEVLVRVTDVAIDRRDVELATGGRPLRLGRDGRRTLGRHVTGTVAAPGTGVDGWPLGRPVVLRPATRVRTGWHLLGESDEGGLAEYVAVPAASLVRLPRGLADDVAIALPMAARAHGLLEHARLRLGESVGIWGVGSLGRSVVALARVMGAAEIVVVDPDPGARAAALALGADTALDPAEVDGARLHLDVVVHAAPDPAAVDGALPALAPEGRAVLTGATSGIAAVGDWGTRTVSGAPLTPEDSLPLVARLAAAGRLRLPSPERLQGGLPAAVERLRAAADGSAGPVVVRP